MGVLLGAHLLGDARDVIPAARGLHELAALGDDFDLPGDLILRRAAHAGEAVHVLDLDLRAEGGGAFGADADVHVAADHALLHVAVGDAALVENLDEGVEIRVGHVRAGEVGLGDDLEERDAGAVEVHAGVAVEVGELADILFQVRAGDAHPGEAVGGAGAVELEVHVAVGRAGLIVLGELVVLRGVGVEVILPVELRVARDLAVEQQSGEHGEAEGLLVRHGQDAGQAEADGADVGVGCCAEGVGAAAPHLRLGLELDVRFETDDSFVFHKGRGKPNHGGVGLDTDFSGKRIPRHLAPG